MAIEEVEELYAVRLKRKMLIALWTFCNRGSAITFDYLMRALHDTKNVGIVTVFE